MSGHGPAWAGLQSAGFDPEALWQRVDGDADLLRELVRVFEEEVPAMVARAEGAMENSDAVGLAKAAHKVKGSVLQFSAHSAAAAAEDLEQLGKSGTLRGAESALRTLKEEVDKLLQLLHGMLREMAR